MSTLEAKRERIRIAEIETQLTNLELVEPLTQSPDLPSPEPPSPDTAEREEDDKANPHFEEEGPSHECGSCGFIFLCVGDANGRAQEDLCDCEQAVLALPLRHLVFYCSTACRHAQVL